MENKNLFLAIILSVGFLFLWSTFVIPRFAPKPAPAATAAAERAAAPASVLKPGHPETTPPKNPAETILRDSENEISFSPQGGGVKHWWVKSKNQQVDLVDKPGVDPLPLATSPETVFSIRLLPRSDQAPSSNPGGAVLQGTLPNGLRVTKTIVLSGEGHLHDLTLRFSNPTSNPIDLKDVEWGWGPGLGTVPSEHKENSGLIRALTMGKLKVQSHKPGEYTEFGQWAGIDNRYYLVAFLPVAAGEPKLKVEGTKENTQVKVFETGSVPPRGQITRQFKLYAGPKGYTQLGKYHKSLEAAVDFGTFSPVGKLVLRSVYWLQSKTGNYGWAIVLLTVILQILMLPLTIKSFKATMAMKTLQPQIAALQKTYKGDPKRLNIEMMNLYKKSGTNPFGGCLPMLLQLPIFWALFTTLRNAYELRGEPFVGWIRDLSLADPYYVMPVVMGLGMFLQQRMAGAVTDPTQRQMMLMMPVIFTVMFLKFPAGLVLYWLTQNIVTMLIQWSLLRINEPKPGLELIK